MVGRKTEKKRLKRSIGKVQETMRTIRHEPMKTQAAKINQILQGHYAYYGMTGNIRCLIKVYQAADNYWRRMLSSRSQKSHVSWEQFDQLKVKFPLLRPKIFIPSDRIKSYAML